MNNVYTAPEADLTKDTQASEFTSPKIFSPSGRIGRNRYLAYNTLGAITCFLLIGLFFLIQLEFLAVILIIGLSIVCTVFTIFWMIKRLHDRNHPGPFWLLSIIPVVNLLLYLYLIFSPGEKLTNNYGHPAPPNSIGLMIAGLGAPLLFIFISGVLAAVAIPAYQQYVTEAKETHLNAEQQRQELNELLKQYE